MGVNLSGLVEPQKIQLSNVTGKGVAINASISSPFVGNHHTVKTYRREPSK